MRDSAAAKSPRRNSKRRATWSAKKWKNIARFSNLLIGPKSRRREAVAFARNPGWACSGRSVEI